jgi:ferredoxin-NADP reductase
MPRTSTARRLLSSPIVDLLVGPHGIDRYLELIRPDLTVRDARAEVTAVRRQTPRSVTVSLKPNPAWGGFRAGQFVRVGVEIDGVRRTRTYSPACSEHADGQLELTVTVHPQGVVSGHLQSELRHGAILHLGEASGSFGSGITPVLSMLRTLCDEGHRGEVAFIHYARTSTDWLYRLEVEALAARHPNVRAEYIATREGGERACAQSLRPLIGSFDGTAAVCGPPGLIDAVRDCWSGDLLSETFTPPSLAVTGAAAEGTLRFLRSDVTAAIAEGSLLEQAEAAGLTPKFGCRMGICHTCACRKSAGAVRNLLTGDVSDEEDEDIQLCVSVPVGDVALEI